jgi:drug/metabolite transporter (DMT)-like permease
VSLLGPAGDRLPISSTLQGHIELAFIGLLWGSSSILIRLVDQTPQFITLGRFAFGALAVTAWGLLTRQRDWSLGPRPFLVIGFAVWMTLTTAAFSAAVKYTSIANAVLISFVAPVVVPFLGRRLLGEAVRPLAVLAVWMAATGIVLMLVPDLTALDRRALVGVGYAGLSAGGTAGAAIGVRLVRRHTPTFNTGLHRMLVAVVVLGPVALVTSPLTIAPRSLALLALLGVLHTGLGMTLYAHAMGRVQAQDAVVYGYLEPLGSVLLAALFLDEPLRLHVAAGGVLILLAGYLVSRESVGAKRAGV